MITVILAVLLWVSMPALTAMNIRYVSSGSEDLKIGIGLLILNIMVNFIQRIINSQNGYGFRIFGLRLSNIVTMLIYKKSLKYSPMSDKTFS